MLLINDTYMLGRRLGNGSFGEVFEGTDVKTRKPVAIKIEPINNEASQILKHEYGVYRDIYQSGCDLAQIYYFGIEDDYNVMVMDALGKSMSELLAQCGGKFSLKTTLMIGDQMISRLEYVHDKCYVHRDLKPENFLVGMGYCTNKIYLIDYGLAKRYRQDDKHISFKAGNKLVGTARYASVNSHLGIRLSRRDDLESLLYILVYFLKGMLPWQNLKYKDKNDKYQAILRVKATITPQTLCTQLVEGASATVDKTFQLFMEHVKSLDFVARPDYHYLRSLLRDLMHACGYQYDLSFDW